MPSAPVYSHQMTYAPVQSPAYPPPPPQAPQASMAAPVVTVSVEGMEFQYQLTEDDLYKVFGRYGTVTWISVEACGTSARITFERPEQGQAAISDLDGKVLNGLQGTLRLGWAAPDALLNHVVAALPPPYPPMEPVSHPVPAVPEGEADCASPIAGSVKAPAHVKGVRKYTCRFFIGIENDNDFQVVRRIIGAKGANMKRIVRQTEAKLRLRGVGSGYLEGAGQRESPEPLQLCVSCTSSAGYNSAVELAEELLEGVYRDYAQHCRERGLPQLDLRASPQLVLPGKSGGSPIAPAAVARGAKVDTSFSTTAGSSSPELLVGESPLPHSPGLGMTSSDDSADISGLQLSFEGEETTAVTPTKREGGRRRGRRSRAKRGSGEGSPGSGSAEHGTPPRGAPVVEEIEAMIDRRNEARRQCNFAEADRIRQSLNERGVALMDEPGARGRGSEVTTWRYWRD